MLYQSMLNVDKLKSVIYISLSYFVINNILNTKLLDSANHNQYLFGLFIFTSSFWIIAYTILSNVIQYKLQNNIRLDYKILIGYAFIIFCITYPLLIFIKIINYQETNFYLTMVLVYTIATYFIKESIERFKTKIPANFIVGLSGLFLSLILIIIPIYKLYHK